MRANCSYFNKIALSQAKTPATEPWIPSAFFKAIAFDFFTYQGWHYSVFTDRLLEWTEKYHIKVFTNEVCASP